MLSDSEKRAAELAVSRYGASQEDVERVVRAVLESKSDGEPIDLVDALCRERLISVDQVRELKLAFEKTQIDLRVARVNSNGSADGMAGDIAAAATLPPAPPPLVDDPANEVVFPRVFGEYRILRKLGQGGMATVYLAYQETLKRHVAIKVLGLEQSMNQSVVDRFYREAKSGALLNHPNIVRSLAVGQERSTHFHYMVMEYVDGPSAAGILEAEGALAIGDAFHIVLDIAHGLEHAHSRNIVHRDIKPSNILLTRSGVAKLADMGLAKRTDEASHLTAARQGFGTPYYMPYEQAVNARQADARSDIYALGATLYHLLIGEVPFNGPSHVEIVEKKKVGEYVPATVLDPQLPKVVDVIIARMMAPEPRQRYQTASEAIVDLERSGLSAAVPSFVDPDRALQDPVVRQRMEPLAATSPDLQDEKDRRTTPDFWYLRYRDMDGRWLRIKLTVRQVFERVRAGRYPQPLEVAQHPQGDFRPLQAYAEFQELAGVHIEEEPESIDEPVTTPCLLGKGPRFWLTAIGAIAATIVVATLIFVALRTQWL